MITKAQGIFFLFIFWFFANPFLVQANFGIKPAFPREDNERTQSIFIQTISPGEEAQEGVRIINNANEEKMLLLYARDSVRSSGGGFACGQLKEAVSGVGSWINFVIQDLENSNIKFGELKNTIEVKITSGEEIIIPFLIKAPPNASVGEHNGCILIQEIKEKNEGEVGVSLSLRSGLRVAINIPGAIIRKIELHDFNIEKKNKSIYLRPSAKNTGNVSIDTQIEVNVRHFFGAKHAKFGGSFPVLRDEVYDFNFELKKPFWGGLYLTKAVLSYDTSEEAGIGIRTNEKETSVESHNIWFFSFPTTLGLIIEIIVFLFLLFLFAIWRLHKKKKRWIKKWVPYTTQEGETLSTISKKYKIHWEILAEVNKIKPPFIIEKGQEIKVPPRRTS